MGLPITAPLWCRPKETSAASLFVLALFQLILAFQPATNPPPAAALLPKENWIELQSGAPVAKLQVWISSLIKVVLFMPNSFHAIAERVLC